MPSTALSILIVTHNTRELLDGCLRSVQRVAPNGCEIIVVDNASTDGTAEYVRREFPNVRLDACDVNLGFAAGMNRAIALAQGKFLLFLNPDTLLPRGSLEILLEVLSDHTRAAVAGAQLTHADGRRQPSVFLFPTLPREFWNTLPELKYFLRLDLFAQLLSHSAARSTSGTREKNRYAVECVSGAAFLARTDAIREIGCFDDGFFLYHDERDLCRRLWNAGWEVWFAGDAQVIHYDAAFTRYRRSRLPTSPVLEYRLLSMDRLWQKHKSAAMHRLWRLQTRGILILRCIFLVIGLEFGYVHALQRIRHLWKTQKLLKGKSILGRDLEGGWATSRT